MLYRTDFKKMNEAVINHVAESDFISKKMGLKRNTLRETTISYFRNLYYIYIKYEAILHIHLNQRDKGAIEICTNLRAGQQPQLICSTLVLPGTRHHH